MNAEERGTRVWNAEERCTYIWNVRERGMHVWNTEERRTHIRNAEERGTHMWNAEKRSIWVGKGWEPLIYIVEFFEDLTILCFLKANEKTNFMFLHIVNRLCISIYFNIFIYITYRKTYWNVAESEFCPMKINRRYISIFHHTTQKPLTCDWTE